ncbi:MAG TPA: tRNA threonylcarbamoyladenosine dehydratase [Methylophilus sp.]|nr:tRNA threonylcarbamoyladenosine dehydratase [Methylophilus sp.]HQQ33557.1 tRNA threonylcarbamoyladenosine dehydratase [Methylophilus sp.]
MTTEMDFERRFGGVRRLYGDAGLARLQAAHLCVIGIGGVGSWAVEALARNAVGELTLIDLDNVAESNVNRQIHALESEFGKAKVTAMLHRILQINSDCKVHEVEDFVTPENVQVLLAQKLDVVIDATDDAKAKVAIAVFCKQNHIPLLVAGAAGGRLDPTRIQTADMAYVQGDKLLAKVRNLLRRDFGFPKGNLTVKKSHKFGLTCVYSNEEVIRPESSCDVPSSDSSITGLSCAGYGSSVSVTATFGFVLAQLAINHIVKSKT